MGSEMCIRDSTSSNAGDFHMRDFPFHFGFYSIESSSGSMETRLRKFHYELSNGRITESLIANPDWYSVKPVPSLTFDGNNKLTVSNFTSTDQEWPPTDGTTSGLTHTDSNKTATWTISGASYGNGEYIATSSSSVDGSSRSGYYAFDKAAPNASTGDSWHTSGTYTAILTLQAPTSFVLSRYELYHRANQNTSENTAPKDWKIEGSNDGTTWVTLDTRTNEVYNPDVQGYEVSKRPYTVTGNSTSYKYHRIDVIKTDNDTGSPIIGEWKLFVSNPRTGTLTDPYGSTYALGQTQDNIYIHQPGNYTLDVQNNDQKAIVTKTVTGTISTPSALSTTNITDGGSGTNAYPDSVSYTHLTLPTNREV